MALEPWTTIQQEGPPVECECRCGRILTTYAQIDLDRKKSVLDRPCPGCGRYDNLLRVKYPPQDLKPVEREES